MNLSVTDDAGATTHFSLRYFRVASGGSTGTPTHPPTTTAEILDSSCRSRSYRSVGVAEGAVMELTVGMATYRDFDGVYFTLQACGSTRTWTESSLWSWTISAVSRRGPLWRGGGGRYILASQPVGTSAPRDLVFREAQGESVLCIDSHVLLDEGVLRRLKRFYREHPDCLDLLQGPLVDDDLERVVVPSRAGLEGPDVGDLGRWTRGARQGPTMRAFEIPMQGLGLFSCRKAAWPGFHPAFRGFGGEEGYIHQKFRNLGRRCLCLPWLRWVHRFGRPAGAPYPLRLRDRMTNYLIGHREVGLDETPVLEHFRAAPARPKIVQALRVADAVLPTTVAPAVHATDQLPVPHIRPLRLPLAALARGNRRVFPAPDGRS